MTNTELSLDQLKGINGGFLLALLLGCGDKDDKKKKNDTVIDTLSKIAICKSGEDHEHPLYPDANCPKLDKK